MKELYLTPDKQLVIVISRERSPDGLSKWHPVVNGVVDTTRTGSCKNSDLTPLAQVEAEMQALGDAYHDALLGPNAQYPQMAEVDIAISRLPTYYVCHRKGEGEGQENRQLYSVQLRIVRHSAWVAGYGWPDYEAPFVTGPTGTGPGTLAQTLHMLATEMGLPASPHHTGPDPAPAQQPERKGDDGHDS